MITRIKRFPYEGLDDYLVKLCLINCCSPMIIFKSAFKCRSGSERTIPEYLFSFSNEIKMDELKQIIDDRILPEINSEVDELFGPFSSFLKHNLEFMYNKNFKYCPKCMEEGNHYLFHQLTFVDLCLVHKVPLIEHCPFCKKKYNSSLIFNMDGLYICTNCKKSLLDYYLKLTPAELIYNNFHRKPFILAYPKTSNLSCLIIDLNPSITQSKNIFPTTGLKFLYNYLLNGIIIKNSDIKVVRKNQFSSYNINDLQNYYFTCGYKESKNDYSQIDLSALATIESVVTSVSKKIVSTYNVENKWGDFNRTNKNVKKDLRIILNNIFLSDKKFTKEQYAFYLWIYSCVFRNNSGRCYYDPLLTLYDNLLSLFFDYFSDNSEEMAISNDIIELTYKITEFYLHEHFLYLLRILENNRNSGRAIRLYTDSILDFQLPFAPILKMIIFKNEYSFESYIFKENDDESENNIGKNDEKETLIGGYNILYRDLMSFYETKREIIRGDFKIEIFRSMVSVI